MLARHHRLFPVPLWIGARRLLFRFAVLCLAVAGVAGCDELEDGMAPIGQMAGRYRQRRRFPKVLNLSKRMKHSGERMQSSATPAEFEAAMRRAEEAARVRIAARDTEKPDAN